MTHSDTGNPTEVGSRLRNVLINTDNQLFAVNIAAIVALAVVAQVVTGRFFTPQNLSGLVIQIVVVTMIACAMTLVMVAGAIDVSVSGVVLLAGIAAGKLILAGLPLWLSILIATALGAAVGALNWFMVTTLKIPPLIATIGTLYATQGVGNLLTNGLPVSGLPASFSVLGNGRILGVPIAAFLIVGFVLAFVGIQRYTVLGRHVIATGSNPQAAFLNGVNTSRTLLICFAFSGAVAGFSGVVYASRIGAPTPILDNDLLFFVIVAIVVGGTGLLGGEGRVFGSFLGSVLIGVVTGGLNLAGISAFWQYIALGVVLVVSVSLAGALRGNIRLFGSSRKSEDGTQPVAPIQESIPVSVDVDAGKA